MTPEEADKAYDEAEPIPMTKAEIDRLVKIATGHNEHSDLDRYDCVIIEGSDDVEFVKDYQGEWVRFDDVCEQSKVIRQLEAENAKLRRDAERFRYIREHMTNASSLHMDGTAYYRLRSPHARARSFDDAIDAEMKGGDS